MFVDASAIVAILLREEEADELADRLQQAEAPFTSGIAIFEAALAIRHVRRASVEEARGDVMEFLELARVKVAPLTQDDAGAALGAYERYGKGQGHPAQLNLADCFAYAMARGAGAPILYKGDDFSFTDLA